MRFLLGVTTYNRLDYLRKCIESWEKTRNKEHDWTLVVADDGSDYGTARYVQATLEDWVDGYKDGIHIEGVPIWTKISERRGIHYQKNFILQEVMKHDFDMGFM